MNPFINYRRCISCRLFAPKESFWRIVRLHPSRQIQLDQGMGRAAYICPQPNCLQLAKQKNRLGRALKASIPETLYESLQERLGTAKQGGPNQD
ncbi:YlxR family protein [Microcystis aeruginosa]|uniref:YlxR family protein n=1 Tax=Microcystis aeruginosa TaxID=1126 RepID=UPI002330F167|nr:YlxR family protein [Microcystis aeruginosa]MDB9412528.1 YlxR family protein [Microcystis aeruginosa CS-567/02]